MSIKETFIIRTEWYDAISELSSEDRLIFFDNLFHYHRGNYNLINLNNLTVKLVWKLIEPDLARNIEKYDKRCETSARNGALGGRPRKDGKPNKNLNKPNKADGLKEKPNNPEYDLEYEYDLDSDNNLYPFELFWNLYDKKVGKKDKVKKKWEKLNVDTQKQILNYLPKYIEAVPDKQFRKNPETFFNNESWNDEIIERGGNNAKGKQFTKSTNDSKGTDRKAEIMRRASQAVANSDSEN